MSKKNNIRFLVIQNGARHDYAVPAAFARLGALSSVFTDLTSDRGLGHLVGAVAINGGRLSSAVQRRSPPLEIKEAVRTSGVSFISGELIKYFLSGSPHLENSIRVVNWISEQFLLLRGTGEATHVYSMLGERGRFVRRAKEKGLGVVGDVYIALSADAIVAREAVEFSDWCDEPPRVRQAMEEQRRNQVLLECSDLLVCPSEFVRDDLVINHGVDASRTCLIPYAVNTRWLSLDTKPEEGRVLFAGSPNLRKGIHYLAEAARLLSGTCSVFVAGAVSEKVRKHPAAKDLHFLGHLSKVEMAAEFARADVFAFPSLAEGSAGVTAEALGAGVPVVTTRAAGSIVRDGLDGFIVPERNSEALAEAVLSISSNRELRAAMSRAARERAQMFTWESFARDVIDATQKLSERIV